MKYSKFNINCLNFRTLPITIVVLFTPDNLFWMDKKIINF